MKKKILAMLLVFVMVLGMFPMSAMAASYAGEAELNISFGSSYGTLNSVKFTGADGADIQGIEVSKDTKSNPTVTVLLPSTYGKTDKVKVTFTVTPKGSKKPGLSTSSKGTSLLSNHTHTLTLSNGSKSQTYYLCSAQGTITGKTVKISISTKANEPPRLTDSGISSGSDTVVAGASYAFDPAPFFTDIDGDTLSYQYSVDGGENWDDYNENFEYSSDVSGMYPLIFRAYDGENYSEETYTVNLLVAGSGDPCNVKVNVPLGIEPDFHVSNAEGALGPEISNAVYTIGDECRVYTISVPDGISHIAWRADGAGMSAAVSEDAELTLVQTTFTVMAGETEDTGATVSLAYGKQTVVGSGNYFLLLSEDGAYTYTLTPTATGYIVTTRENWTPVGGEQTVNLEKEHFKVIAPVGSVVSAGKLNGGYKYIWAEPISIETVGNTVVYRYDPIKNSAEKPFIRVQRPEDPDAVTYWDFKSSKNAGDVITVTEEMLFMNDGETTKFDSDTVYRHFEQYEYDLADIFMNINAQGYINLEIGGTKELNMFRNWQAINSINNNMVALPDFSYEIINIEGDNVISITPDANNSAVAQMTANGAGTAIVLVTYDAMFSELALKDNAHYETQGKPARFSAIWPDRTGVFVVSVGKDGSAIQTNMTINEREFDAEHTPLFYIGDAGAEYSFKPEVGCTVTVNRSTVGTETLSFGSFTNQGVTVAEDGTVTVYGLTSGRHIIKVEKDGVATYQVVTATEVAVTMTDIEGNPLTDDNKVKPGETAIITVNGLTNPAEKFAAAYNGSAGTSYVAEDGTKISGDTPEIGAAATGYATYGFSSQPTTFEVKIPNSWRKNTFELADGVLAVSGLFGRAIGGHREFDYKEGRQSDGVQVAEKLGRLPDLIIPVGDPIPATAVTLDKTSVSLTLGELLKLSGTIEPSDSTDAIIWSSSDETIATVSESGIVTTVGEGAAVITATAGDKNATCAITVGAASGIVIEPYNTDASANAHRKISSITLRGVQGELRESNDSANTGKTYTVELAADTDKTKAITVEAKALLRSTTAATLKKIYLWANTPNATNKSHKNLNEFGGYDYPGAVAVVPEWTAENTAVLYVGLGTTDAIVTDAATTPVYTINLKIAEPDTVAVESIALDKTVAALAEGETITLTATVVPDTATNKAVTWTSDNEAVAIVDANGVVTAVAEGSATITVTTADGGKTDTCAVTVYAPVVAVESVSVAENAEVEVGKTVSLTATVLPENADNKAVTWSSSDESIATVDANGVVSGIANGTATITVTTVDGGKTDTCAVTVYTPVVAVESVTIAESAEVEVGETVSLSATVLPENADNKAVTWSSSDENVATVDANGVVSGIANGTATITVTTADGGKTDTCVVTVMEIEDDGEEIAYISISRDGEYLKLADGLYAAHIPVNIDALREIDLADYELEHYLYDADEDGEYEVTALHLLIYMHDTYFGSWIEDVGITGNAGSTFIGSGLFGWPDCNLNYYVNGEYPLQPGSEITGATSDQIVLNNGDFVDISSYTDWGFRNDPGTGYHYFLDGTGAITYEYEVTTGTELTITLGRAGGGYGNGGTALNPENPNNYLTKDGYVMPLYYGESLYASESSEVYIDSNGKASITFNTAGTYILWAPGGYSEEENELTNEIFAVSSPAYAVVTVTDASLGGDDVITPEPATYTVTLPNGEGYTAAATEGSTSPVNEGGSYSFTVTINEGYEAGESFAVKANGVALTAVEGVYTIANITENQNVTVEGVVEKETEGGDTPDEPELSWQEVMAKTKAYLIAQATETAPVVASQYGEWVVIGLARNGVDAESEFFAKYYENVVAHVQDKLDENGRLHISKSTDNSRVILALTALGKDVTNVGGHNLLKGLSNTAYVKNQGVNGPIWALIALDSADYEIPADADSTKQVTREWLIAYILEKELEGGGWALSGSEPDDMTPMAVQALAPYYESDAEVKAAVDRALAVMETMSVTTETYAQIIVARSALGLDSEAALENMLTFALEDGTFRKVPNGDTNQMSTEQAFYAMVAYERYKNDENSLYDMSDVVIEDDSGSGSDGPTDPDDPNDPDDPGEGGGSGSGDEPEDEEEEKLIFGLTQEEIAGWVIVSFEDKGVRRNEELSDIEPQFRKPLGSIVPMTRVPFKIGDTVAAVTLRLLEEKGLTAYYQGDAFGGFYLEAIGDFTVKGTYYESFGEFDAGVDSGWMITWDDWFINEGASEFTVENNDLVKWQYTCQLGEDIGDPYWSEGGGGGGGGSAEDEEDDEEVEEDEEADAESSKTAKAEEVFADVKGHWGSEAINYVYEKGLMNGISDTEFAPNATLNRAMLVTILYRMAGEPEVAGVSEFNDVSADTWYSKAVIWAAANGIVDGVSDTEFAPTKNITREQMAVMLMRYANYMCYSMATDGDVSAYADNGSISAWAKEAVEWANAEGLINGRTEDTIVPGGTATRAEAATILMRFLESVAK